MIGDIRISVKSDVDTSVFEKLEDKIRDLLEEEGLKADIYDDVTGNTTVTRNSSHATICDSDSVLGNWKTNTIYGMRSVEPDSDKEFLRDVEKGKFIKKRSDKK